MLMSNLCKIENNYFLENLQAFAIFMGYEVSLTTIPKCDTMAKTFVRVIRKHSTVFLDLLSFFESNKILAVLTHPTKIEKMFIHSTQIYPP